MKKSWIFLFATLGFAVLFWAFFPKTRFRRESVRSQLKPTKFDGAAWRAANAKDPAWQQKRRVFEREKVSAARLMRSTTRIEAFRLVTNGNEKSAGKIESFPIFGRARIVTTTQVAPLASLVLSPHSYVLPGTLTKQCYFEPGVALRFWRGQENATLLICFGCSDLVVLENNRKIPLRSVGGVLNGRYRVGGSFDPARKEIAAQIRTLFAGEKVFAQL